MAFKTEFEFTLPKGFVDDQGNLHRKGVMRLATAKDEIIPLQGSLYMTRDEWSRSWKAWLRGAVLGFPIGAMPAGGAEIPTFLSYWIEKRLSKKPE